MTDGTTYERLKKIIVEQLGVDEEEVTPQASFVEDLNGEFALVVYDRSQRRLAFVTDRFATHPLFVATPSDDTMVVGSRVQALPTHPAVDAAVDREFLHEYLSLRRVFGVETPLAGVRELPPASVTEVDLTDCSTETTTYWRPHYDPVEKPFSYFVDRLADVFQTLFEEWTEDKDERKLRDFEVDVPDTNHLRDEVEEFAEAIRNDDVEPEVGAEEATRNVAVVLACKRSAEENRPVEVQEILDEI